MKENITVKKLLIFLLLSIFPLFTPQASFADTKFQTTADTTYTVLPSGTTHVDMNGVIENTTNNYYVTTYSLQLGYSDITNVKATDPSGPIVPVIQKTQDGEQIQLQFNSIVYGLGTKLPFTISFDTNTIASHNGDVWEVNIPGLSNQTDFASFTVHVVVPPSFGEPTYIKPEQPSSSLTFTKDQLGKAGISLGFGTKQAYDFSLKYHLQNPNLFPVSTDIALPPDTNYQTIMLSSLSPQPSTVRLDSDGNWMASYTLLPSQTETVTARGTVFVALTPQEEVLPDKVKQIYLQPTQYWQTQDGQIQALAKQLKTPENIYDYVVSHLSYDFQRITTNQVRLGAVGVLQNPTKAVCLEFTDLFIAIARAAGIPAREIDGYGYTQNTKERPISLEQDILHAWPEYYDESKKEWIMVDPTWGNTTDGVDYFHTLDFDHIAFAIQGTSSDYPVPAGGYKIPNQPKEKDIDISFSQQTLPTQSSVTAAFLVDQTYFSGFPVSGNVVIRNTGSILFPSQTISVLSSTLTPRQQQITTTAIPPYGSVTVPFSFQKTAFLTNKWADITIGIGDKTYQKSIHIVPFTQIQLIIGGIILGIFGFIILIIATRTRRVSNA